MTSPQQSAANRANAQKSTGPRSQAGKARSARNALKHGLAAPVALDSAIAGHIMSLARSVVGDQADDSPMWIYAQQIAEAELDLARIRQARVRAWNQQAAQWTSPTRQPLPDQRDIETYQAISGLLARIDRYECRALSRRRTALRALQKGASHDAAPTV